MVVGGWIECNVIGLTKQTRKIWKFGLADFDKELKVRGEKINKILNTFRRLSYIQGCILSINVSITSNIIFPEWLSSSKGYL